MTSSDTNSSGMMGGGVEDRFWAIVDANGLAVVPSDMWEALDVIARRSGKYEALIRALHDAIMSPKGVVPVSAEPFYRSCICREQP